MAEKHGAEIPVKGKPYDGYVLEKVPKGATMGLGKGQWKPIVSDGVSSARICCPDCGDSGSLAERWKIDALGMVHPSVHCDCGFHRFVFLEGWEMK